MENKIARPYDDLVELKDKLQNKRDHYRRQLEQLENDLQSVTRSLELLGDTGTRTKEEYSMLPSELHGLTQLEALKKIARNNSGTFYVKEAKRLLVAAGLINNPKHVSNIVYNLIERSDAFHRVRRGLYMLVELANEETKKPLLLEASR